MYNLAHRTTTSNNKKEKTGIKSDWKGWNAKRHIPYKIHTYVYIHTYIQSRNICCIYICMYIQTYMYIDVIRGI